MKRIVTESGSIASSPHHTERKRTSIITNTMAKLPSSALSMPSTIASCHTTLRYVSPAHSTSTPAGGGFALMNASTASFTASMSWLSPLLSCTHTLARS